MNTCIKCGSTFEGKFCNECGEEARSIICSKCGTPIVGKFCSECGTKAELVMVKTEHSSIEQKEISKVINLSERGAISGRMCSIAIRNGHILIEKTSILNGSSTHEIDPYDVKRIEYLPYKFMGLGKEDFGYIRFITNNSKQSSFFSHKEIHKDVETFNFGTFMSEKSLVFAEEVAEELNVELIRIDRIQHKYSNPNNSNNFSIFRNTKVNQRKELDSQGIAHCPKCLSTSLVAQKKGFGIGKAIIGAATPLGPLGLIAGNIGAKKMRITCLKCGHQFWAGKK